MKVQTRPEFVCQVVFTCLLTMINYLFRAYHYITVPVQFKPKAEGMFEDVFVVLTAKYSPINIHLYGKAIAKK